MTQPLALRLAAYWTMKNDQGEYIQSSLELREDTATELRRLHAEVESLREANERFGQRQAWWAERMFAHEQTMRQALEALELRCGTNADERQPDGAITALREALGNPKSSPDELDSLTTRP